MWVVEHAGDDQTQVIGVFLADQDIAILNNKIRTQRCSCWFKDDWAEKILELKAKQKITIEGRLSSCYLQSTASEYGSHPPHFVYLRFVLNDCKIVQDSKPEKQTEEKQSEADAKTKEKIEAQKAAVEQSKWHTWTSADGKFTIEAKFVKFNGRIITLTKKDGTTIDVPREKLSDEDLEWIKHRR